MPVTNGTHYAVNGMQYKISVIMPGLNEEENVSVKAHKTEKKNGNGSNGNGSNGNGSNGSSKKPRNYKEKVEVTEVATSNN